MVCILCDSKTKTTNSRYSNKLRQTWRRHTCLRCSAIFTTREYIDMPTSYRVSDTRSNDMSIFDRDKLFLSIARALEHRQNYIPEASAITNTVVAKLIAKNRPIFDRTELIETVSSVLHHFSPAAATIYRASNPSTD